MEDERYQKELFEFEKPKKVFPKLGRIFPRNDFALTLTLEKIIFVSIGVIMLMVIIYALGVERGKSENAKVVAPAVSQRAATVKATRPPAEKTSPAVSLSAAPIAAKQVLQPAPQEKIADENKPYYTIIAVTFTRQDTAAAEAARLKTEGFDAFVSQSDRYFVVCIGKYPGKEAAQKSLGKIKKLYKDAYVKLR